MIELSISGFALEFIHICKNSTEEHTTHGKAQL